MDKGQGNDKSGNVVRNAERSAIRPGALGGEGGGDKPVGLSSGEHVNEKDRSSSSSLVDAEKNASKDGFYRGGDNMDGVKDAEEKSEGLYSSRGRNDRGKKRRGGIFIKKKGPIFTIVISIAISGGIFAGLQAFQPFSLIAQFTESFNSMHTSANKRSNFFLRLQMDAGRVKSPSKGTLFGNREVFSISKKQAAKLKSQGIEYIDNYENSGVKVLKFDDGTDTPKIVVMNESDINKIGGANEIFTFDRIYSTNSDFFHGYNAGSMTWRGAIAGWFGDMTVKFLQSNNLTRNMFADFQEKVRAAKAGNTKSVAQEILAERTGTIEDGGTKMKGADEEVGTDEDGNAIRQPVEGSEVVPGSNGSKEPYSPSSKPGKEGEGDAIRNSFSENAGTDSSGGKISRADMTADTVRTKLDDISGKVQKGANIACTVLNVVGSISMLVTAAEALQIINLTTAYFESVDKTKAGYGDDTPIHDFATALNEQKETTYSQIGTVSVNGSEVTTNIPSEGETRTRSAMQSSGVSSLYSGDAVDSNDASVKTFNLQSSIKGILGGLGASMAMYEGCAIAKFASNMVSAITSALEIAGCILGAVGAAFTFGMSSAACAPLVAKIARGVAMSIAIGVAVAAVISIITPIVTQSLTRDLISDIGGEDLGNALTSGANMYLGNTHRANGGSLATYDKYKDFAVAKQEVIAENAKYERESLSPFDITSKNTFLGSLLTKFMSFRSTTSFMSTLTAGSSVISSSIASLSPGAMAYNVAETLPDPKKYEDICPYLASIGATGDVYCNPYSITDMSTSETDPADVITYLDSTENFAKPNFSGVTNDGEVQNVKIAGDSELAKYIVYCDQRESTFGIADQNIANEIGDWATAKTESSAIDSVANSAIGAIPVFGDIVDVVNNGKILSNIGYVSGESCVAGNTVQENLTEDADENLRSQYATESSSWSKAKYFQRFIEDQSLAESMGLIEKSAVTSFLEEYREEYPLDNSYEGILARKSGLTKDTVVAILDLVDYADFIANYDPSTRYSFGSPAVQVEDELLFDLENTLEGDGVMPQTILYADIRNRSFAV